MRGKERIDVWQKKKELSKGEVRKDGENKEKEEKRKEGKSDGIEGNRKETKARSTQGYFGSKKERYREDVRSIEELRRMEWRQKGNKEERREEMEKVQGRKEE